MEKLKCAHCSGDCRTGMLRLQDGTIICADCIYEFLGGDHENGHDWKFSVMTAAAQEIRDRISGRDS